MTGADAESDGEAEAEGGSDEGDPFDFEELRDGELHTDGEHEEDDADLGHQLEGVDVVDAGAGGEGGDDEAGEDVAEDEGLTEAPGEETDGEGGGEDESDVAEDEDGMGQGGLRCEIDLRCGTARGIVAGLV
jgi:hypothetical protein